MQGSNNRDIIKHRDWKGLKETENTEMKVSLVFFIQSVNFTLYILVYMDSSHSFYS